MAKKKTKAERVMPEYVKKKRAGRPPEITQEIINKVAQSILIGNYFETAMASAGFNKDTGYSWLKRGNREPGTIYQVFSDAVRKAEADSESRDVMVVEMHAHGAKAQFDENNNKIRAEIKRDVKVAQWRLERKFPKRWGRVEKIEHTGKDGGPMTFTDLIVKLESEKNRDEEE